MQRWGRAAPHNLASREQRLLLATYCLHCSPPTPLPPSTPPVPPLPSAPALLASRSERRQLQPLLAEYKWLPPFLPGLGTGISWHGPRKLPAVSRLPTRPPAPEPPGGRQHLRQPPAFLSGWADEAGTILALSPQPPRSPPCCRQGKTPSTGCVGCRGDGMPDRSDPTCSRSTQLLGEAM